MGQYGRHLQPLQSRHKMTSSVLALLLLAGLSASLTTTLVEPPANKMIHDMMDAIESGMKDPVEEMEQGAGGKGRAFWLISVTLTSTSTVVETDTTTLTVTPSCVDGVFMECTEMPETTTAADTTTMAATTTVVPRRKKENKNKRNKNKRNKKKNKKHQGSRNEEFLDLVSGIYKDAVMTDEYGVERDISELLSSQARSRSYETGDVEEFYMRNDVPSLQGGQLSWKEMSVEGLEKTPCSRKGNSGGKQKRPRIITIDNVMETVTYTSTSTITESAFTTATFSVSLASCTPVGFAFPVPLCTDLPTTTEMDTTTTMMNG